MKKKQPPKLEKETIVNFRDLGGIPAADGRIVKPKRLLRSAQLDTLTPEEAEAFARDYELKVVVDFRSVFESERHPDTLPDGVEYINLDVMTKVEEKAPSMFTFEEIKTEKKLHRYMQDVYVHTINDEYAQQCYTAFLRRVIELDEGSVLFHCFAGKDRTGLAAAMLLTLLGASKEDIFEDYLRTNIMRARQNQEIMAKERAKGKSMQEVKVLYQGLCVHSDYLTTTYAAIEKKYGSFMDYMTAAMGVTSDDISRLRNNYLIDG